MPPYPQPHIAPRDLLQRYGIYLMSGVLFFFAVEVVASQFLEITFKGSPVGFLIIFCAAMLAGHYWYNAEKHPPASRRIWQMAAFCAALTLVLQCVLVLALMAVFSGEAKQFLAALGDKSPLMFLMFAGLMLMIMVFLIWGGLAWGIRQAIKKAEKA